MKLGRRKANGIVLGIFWSKKYIFPTTSNKTEKLYRHFGQKYNVL